ncbi:response regulator [Paradesertivirga mongoliensis]|uniref:Response regulator n=1 Tax=Paradesertivirga mongoliensis TaxID=2100740 RepID=A0ABW4ZJD9_9SPHI|nr:response regulator [Pedobacter mongoliensis]
MLNKVLFIDDDSVALMLYRKLVEKSDFARETLTALNGRAALEYFSALMEDNTSQDYPKLIFLDLNMPVLDGWDFLKEFSSPLYSPFKSAKIIILSSSINPEDLERSREFEMVIDFISKPVTIEVLEGLMIRFRRERA